jgi:metal-responsive CopG/Arc/MetJ family transcriptional regulator
MKETVRTTVVLSRDLVAAIDRIAGARRRSEYVEEAVADRVRRDQQLQALREAAGVLNPADYPDWETPEKTSAWVHRRRRDEDAHSMNKAHGDRDYDPSPS